MYIIRSSSELSDYDLTNIQVHKTKGHDSNIYSTYLYLVPRYNTITQCKGHLRNLKHSYFLLCQGHRSRSQVTDVEVCAIFEYFFSLHVSLPPGLNTILIQQIKNYLDCNQPESIPLNYQFNYHITVLGIFTLSQMTMKL